MLKVIRREGNILSPILRNAWDGKALQTLTRQNPIRIDDPHISLVGHITQDELLASLSNTDIANGLGNRFLYFSVHRTKDLPEGGCVAPEDVKMICDELKASIDFAKTIGLVKRNSLAKDLWELIYKELSSGYPGLAGSLLGRAEAQVLRLSLIQAILNRKSEIDEDCITCAKDIFEYCIQSVRGIYGDQTGSALADRIKEYLDREPEGISRGNLLERLNRNPTRENFDTALKLLKNNGLANFVKVNTSGRPAELWYSSIYKDKYELNEKSIPLTSFNSYSSGEGLSQ